MLGHVDLLTRGAIAGWAANPANPGEAVVLRLSVNERRMAFKAVDPRDDLTALFEGATGRYGFRLTDQLLPLSPFVDNHVEVVFARNGERVAGGNAVIPALGSVRARLRPLVVTTSGRSGSSLLMARLARHPGIVVGRAHPYELKLLSYYTKAFNVLTSDADRQRSADPDTMLVPANRFTIGFNPFHDGADSGDPQLKAFWAELVPDRLRSCFASLIDEHYRRVAQANDRTDAGYFAEKVGTSDLARQGTQFLFGGMHEIILVRDPRDVICSSKAFWQRGFTDSVRALKGQYLAMARPRGEANVQQLVVKYESLLSAPMQTMAEIFGFLDLADATDGIDADAERLVFDTHGTSGSPEATLGRWRHELTSDEITFANSELAQVLTHFDYALQ